MKKNNELKDNELMSKILEAQRNNLNFVKFKHEKSHIRIKIKKLYTEGIMQGNISYYGK